MDQQILENWFANVVKESGDYGISSYQLSNIHRVICESMNELPDDYKLPLEYVCSKITSKNLKEKRSATSILGLFNDNESFCELLLLLSDKDRDTRGRALYSIGLRALENTPNELLPLLNDEDEKIRLIVVNVLAKFKSPANIRHLLDKTHDIDREVEIEAIQNLKLIIDPLIESETLKKIFEVWIDNPPSLSSTLLTWIYKCELGFAEKINLLFDVIANSMVTQMEFNPQIIHAISGGIKEEQRDEILTTYFVEKLIVSDVPARILQIIARLLIELNGGSSLGQKNAAIRVAKKRDSLPEPSSTEIKDKMNNLIMLVDPLFIDREEKEKKEKLIGQIQKGFQETYVEVTSQMTERTMREWETTVGQAKLGFSARLYMNIAMFILGVLLTIAGILMLFLNNFTAFNSLVGTGVSLIAGIGTMAVTLFFGPLREIARSVADVGVLNTTLIGYIHRVLQISHTFEYLYLTQKMDLDSLSSANELLDKATQETADNLFSLIDRQKEQKKHAAI